MKSVVTKALITGAMFLGVFGFIKDADAAVNCADIKAGNCSCRVVHGASVLDNASAPCNVGAGTTACIRECTNWGAAPPTKARVKAALLRIKPPACGVLNVDVQYSANVNSYKNLLSTTIDTGRPCPKRPPTPK